MKNEQLHREFERLIGYDVQDSASKKLGTVHSVWADDEGHNLFLSVKTGWLFGKHHVVPAQSATANDKQRAIRLPFTEAKIKDAPSFDENADLLPADEERIYRYYNLQPRLKASKAAFAETAEVKTKYPATAAEILSKDEARADYGGMGKTEKTTDYDKMGKTEYGTKAKSDYIEAKSDYDTTGKIEGRIGREPLVREGEATMKLSEEELKIGKREVVVGGMRLHKIVRKEKVSQPVDLKRERFVVERVAATGKAEHEFEAEDVFIPLRKEEAIIGKESHIREEVRIRKEAFTERETVSDELRREDVEIEENVQDARFAKDKALAGV